MFLFYLLKLLLCFANIVWAFGDDQFVYDWGGEVYVLPDVHGDYDTVVKLLREAKIIDDILNWIADNTLLIQLGDVIDKGPDSDKLMRLLDHLRTQAELKGENKVILLMGDHEYYAATDSFDDAEYSKTDALCFGGLEKKKFMFSDDQDFHRKFVMSLKMAVVVNKIFYTHAAFNQESIQYACKNLESVKKSPETCLREINKIALDRLPTQYNNYYTTGEFTYFKLFQRVPTFTSEFTETHFCEQHKEFIKAFGASFMIIGHEVQSEMVQLCKSLFFVNMELSQWLHSTEEEHNASIVQVQFKTFFKKFNLFLLVKTIYHEKFVYEWEGPIFVLADTHGDYDTVVKLLKKAKIIDNKLKWKASNTLLIQLGDVIDRGPDSNKLMRLFNYLRESAQDKYSEVILLMGNHEYRAGKSDQYGYETHDHGFDTLCFGGLDKKNKLFSDNNGFYRMYVKSLKMAVMVNGMIFSHTPFIQEGIENSCNETLSESPEACLRKLNQIALECLPTKAYEEGEQRQQVTNSIYHLLSRKIKEIGIIPRKYNINGVDQTLPERVTSKTNLKFFCSKINTLLDNFGASHMFTGDEPSSTIGTLCDDKLYLLDLSLSRWLYKKEVKNHNAVITRINFEEKKKNNNILNIDNISLAIRHVFQLF
eukprot:GHVR01192441.1.p1 GENE.GHVR01192441.1~~GHVR01192441.1.p1  ORF type:complete len:650 (+),score=65.72 GHVR01192441.1:201-2150(+)